MTIAVASLIFLLAAWGCSPESGGTDAVRDGAFEFPQDEAIVLCDRTDLRLSVWNNREVLFVQAVLWTDDDETTSTRTAVTPPKWTASTI